MKKALIAIALLALTTGSIARAASISVDFGSLTEPVNILGSGTSINGVNFSYDPAGDPGNPPTPCAFDAGQGGTQFTFACVGAQVDSSGLAGTTDGGYVLNFSNGIFALQFGFGLLSTLTPIPEDEEFGVTALFFNGPDLTDIFTVSPDGNAMICDGFGGCQGGFQYTGPGFNQVVLNFIPASTGDELEGMAFGQTLVNISDMSYDEVPEPGTFILLAFGLAGFGATKFLRRRI
jgi:hypothetical protein